MMVDSVDEEHRVLIVLADDFGIGPATSRGILDLAEEGLVSATALLVTSPFAMEAVRTWQKAGEPVELGWHVCLTLDAPVHTPDRIPSIVRGDGRFLPLGRFLARLSLGRIDADDLEREIQAQYRRFCELVGRPPTFVNTHHHLQVFPLVGEMIRRLLAKSVTLPYVRRVQEPLWGIVRTPGARLKRATLTALGRRVARRLALAGFPGNDVLLGIGSPSRKIDFNDLPRVIRALPGKVVELVCHPGYPDSSLLGRDCRRRARHLDLRLNELLRLRGSKLRERLKDAGVKLAAPSFIGSRRDGNQAL